MEPTLKHSGGGFQFAQLADERPTYRPAVVVSLQLFVFFFGNSKTIRHPIIPLEVGTDLGDLGQFKLDKLLFATSAWPRSPFGGR